jgi:two-component system chemotaxis response regulator CheY
LKFIGPTEAPSAHKKRRASASRLVFIAVTLVRYMKKADPPDMASRIRITNNCKVMPLTTMPWIEKIMSQIDLERLRFVVIDDNAHMRRMLRTLLFGFGVRDVKEAEDGAAGLEAFIHHTPDIMITDWAIPIFNGLELTQMIREPGANANPCVPIIMITGYRERERVILARDAGVTEFLVKPISADSLYKRIVSVVANSRPFIKTKTYFGPDRRRNVNPNYSGSERRTSGEAEVIRQPPMPKRGLFSPGTR